MCIACLLFVVEFLPFIALVTIPLFGSFCGTDVVLRFSLLICLNCVLGGCIPKLLYSVIPYLQVATLTVLVLLPVNLTPWPIVWLYDKVLWLTEPLLLVAEVVQLLLWDLKLSEFLTSRLESSDDEDVWKWKGVILTLSGLCYCVTIALGIALVMEENASSKWFVFAVFLLAIGVHNMMWMSNQGVISDAAFVTMCSMSVLYVMSSERAMISHPTVTPDHWDSVDKSKSYIGLMYVMAKANIDNAKRALVFLRRFLSPIFLMSVVVRLCCLLSFSDVVIKYLKADNSSEERDEDEFDEIDMENPVGPYKSPITLKLAVIFMFSQLVTQHLYECAGLYPVDKRTLIGSAVVSVWPTDVLIGRLLQVAAISVLYMYRLYRADDWTNDEWS